MADLLEDYSPLQINTEGQYKGGKFTVIGRVQYQYTEGVWNEWYILFSNGKSGWLSEASGNYVMSFVVAQHDITAPADSYQISAYKIIAGQKFTVTGIEKARCIAGEGELPFRVHSGFDTVVVDLTNETSFASIDFSDAKPTLFLGEQVVLSELFLKGLRETKSKAVTVKSFKCPACAAPVTVNITNTQTIVCNSCTALLDVSDKNVKTLRKYQNAANVKPRIELGSIGRFDGVDYQVTGFMRRQVAESVYKSQWDEYLLYHPIQGFRWLIEAKGHWNLATQIQKFPKISNNWSNSSSEVYLEKRFKHYEKYKSKVAYVLGEFYWRVSLDDATEVNDFISPPSMLSQEKTGKEVGWTQAEYIEYRDVETAFKLDGLLPEPSGIAPNQPSAYDADTPSFIKAVSGFIVLGLFIHLFFIFFSSNRLILDTNVTFEHKLGASSFQSETFNLQGRNTNLVISQYATLGNDWLATEITLIEKNTGKSYGAGREMSFYSGYDSDGSWTEDSSRSEIILSNIPAGNYYLEVLPFNEVNVNANNINDHIQVYRDVLQWSNLWLLWAFLMIIPLIFYYLKYRFEVKRWEDSDHPITTGS